ncbi:MAG: LptF/LptG family permease [Myxococcota bacterium]|nr:LptF/LptG family permease [Myxococcota bacterium]
MRILSRYFATRYLGIFAAVLIVSMLTIVVIEMLLNLDDMLSAGDGPGSPIQYLMLRIPSYYLRELIPIASFAAAFSTLGLSTHRYEVSAAKAGGISPDRLLAPILVAAVFVGLASFVLSETWVVSSTRDWNRLESGGSSPFSYRAGSFWYQRDRTIFSISEADASQRTLRGVRIFDLNSAGRLTRSVDAAQVDVLNDHRWRFTQATVRHYQPDDPEAIVRTEQLDTMTLDVADPRDMALVNTDFNSLTSRELIDHIETRRRAGESTSRVATVLYSRAVEPLVVVIFALLAAPFGLRTGIRRGFGIPALLGIAPVSTFFALRSVGITLASEGVISPQIAIGALVGLFAISGAIHLRFIER